MSFTHLLANLVEDFSQIVASPSRVRKTALIRGYLAMTAKEVAIRRGLVRQPETEAVGSHRVRFISYAMLRSEWREIFIRGPYYFESDNPVPVILDVGSNSGIS